MKDILVHATNYTDWTPAMQRAAIMAAGAQGTLTAAFVCPSPTMTNTGLYGSMEVMAALIESIRAMGEEAYAYRESFEKKAKELGVGRAHWQVAEGYVPNVLQHLGNWHDLLVLDRGVDTVWASPPELGSIILTARMPTLVIPSGVGPQTATQCIAVAWNGAPEGLRALHAALPMLRRAERVFVLRGARRNPFMEIGWRPQFSLEAYLSRQNVQADFLNISASDEEVGAALLEAATSVSADLLVMGAYGRPRFSEWVFGGATRHVLHHATMPVLFRH